MPISRREMVAGIATTLTTTPAGAKTDTELVALGKQFDALTRVLDTADLWGDMADALDRIERAILNTQAKTMEGLCVKARAACWADSAISTQQAVRQQTNAWRCPLSAISSGCSIRSLSSPAPYRRFLLTSNKAKRAMSGGPVTGQAPPARPGWA